VSATFGCQTLRIACAPAALGDYARTPVTVTPLKSDALLRLLICDLVGEAVTRESMGTLREEIAALRERVDDSARAAAEYPHRAAYLLLVVDFLRRFLDLHEQLVDEVEREFATDSQSGAARRND